jgi:hypothetical protein
MLAGSTVATSAAVSPSVVLTSHYGVGVGVSVPVIKQVEAGAALLTSRNRLFYGPTLTYFITPNLGFGGFLPVNQVRKNGKNLFTNSPQFQLQFRF